jgi:hypothetical protein
MKHAQPKKRIVRRLSVTAIAILAFACGNASAWKIVYDPTLHQSTVSGMYKQYMQTIKQYTQDADAYLKEYQHMQQQLTQLSQVFKLSELMMTQGMTERSLSYGSEVCGSDATFSMSNVFSLISSNLNGDIVSQQKAKCLQIVNLQNMK